MNALEQHDVFNHEFLVVWGVLSCRLDEAQHSVIVPNFGEGGAGKTIIRPQ